MNAGDDEKDEEACVKCEEYDDDLNVTLKLIFFARY